MRIMDRVATVAATIIALGFWAAGSLSAMAEEPSAKAFVDGIYQSYVGPEGTAMGVDTGSDAAVRKWFAPALADAIIADADAADARGEVPMLDGDPFLNAQEWQLDGFQDVVTETGPGKARAVVTFDSYYEHHTITLDLELIDDAWKIAEIDYGGDRGTLSGMVAAQVQ